MNECDNCTRCEFTKRKPKSSTRNWTKGKRINIHLKIVSLVIRI